MRTYLDNSLVEKLLNEFIEMKKIVANFHRPSEQVILDDVELREFLKVSKRTTAYWREKGLITYSQPGAKIYYKLSDVLLFLKQHEIQSIDSQLMINL